jgi:hypothetical protein
MGMIANMATRYDKSRINQGTFQSGYEGPAADDFAIPSCGPEDVDRAFFDLFNEVLPLFYRVTKESAEQRRIPVIFATGERFSVASKREPFRDKNGALILPIISITRSGIEQDSSKHTGYGHINETVVRKRVSKQDPVYQNMINAGNFRNAQNSKTGDGARAKDYYAATGRSLINDLGPNIYEIFVIPSPKYFTLKYEVTLWCQYVQQSNDFLSAIMGAYIQPGNKTIKITSKKGYWFVAYFDPSVSQDNNFSDSSDSERLIKITLTAEVPGYLILPKFPGSSNGTRKYLSAPQVTFSGEESTTNVGSTIPTGGPGGYILNDIMRVEDPLVVGEIGVDPILRAEELTNGKLSSKNESSAVGNQQQLRKRQFVKTYEVDPYTGKEGTVQVTVVESVPSKGEEVIVIDQLINVKRNG